jgi:hypothetical protein
VEEVVDGGVVGGVEDIAREEFVAGGVEVHFGERGFEIDLLEFLEEVLGGFFGGAAEVGVEEVAEEAGGVVEEWGDFGRGEAAWVRDGAAEDFAWDLEDGARGGIAEGGAEVGEDLDGDVVEGVVGAALGVGGVEFIEGGAAATGEEVAEVEGRGGHRAGGIGAGEGVVAVVRAEAVGDGEVVEEGIAGAGLDEVVVEVVEAAGVGADEDAIGGEVGADLGAVDGAHGAGEVLALGGGLEGIALAEEGVGGGWGEGDEEGGEFAVEGDGEAVEADEGVDVAEVAAGEAGAIEGEGIGRGEGGGGAGLEDGVGVGGEEDAGEVLELRGREVRGEEAVVAVEEDDGEGGGGGLAFPLRREVRGGAGEAGGDGIDLALRGAEGEGGQEEREEEGGGTEGSAEGGAHGVSSRT